MEECEALCQRATIMHSGQIRCIGSLPHLKSKYGKGYQVEISAPIYRDDDQDDSIMEFMTSSFPQSSLTERHASMFKFCIPKDHVSLGKVFSTIENRPAYVPIVNYSVSEVGIDQIFMQMAKIEEPDENNVDEHSPKPADTPNCLYRYWPFLALLCMVVAAGIFTFFQAPVCFGSSVENALQSKPNFQ
eukprot:45682_1